jgi:hypothetical protein
MTKKNFWLEILVMVLVFGMTAVGCANDDDSTSATTDPALNGTWVAGDMELKLDNGSFELSEEGLPLLKGTFTTSGNSMTSTPTHFNPGKFLGGDAIIWLTQTQALGYITAEEDKAYINGLFVVETKTYVIAGNILTMTSGTNVQAYTKKQ